MPLWIEKTADSQDYTINPLAVPVDSILEASGFNQEEYHDFLYFLIQHGFVNGSPKLKTLIACEAGIIANIMTTCHESYAIFASKTPDFSIQNVPASHTTIVKLKDFIHYYGDLIMTVGSDFSTTREYRNRGIFRNPMSVIENKHKGISMILHGFSAAVAQKFFPAKEIMCVTPIGSMQAIISNSPLERKDFKMTDEEYERAKAITNFRETICEVATNKIHILALAHLYYESSTDRQLQVISSDELSVGEEAKLRF